MRTRAAFALALVLAVSGCTGADDGAGANEQTRDAAVTSSASAEATGCDGAGTVFAKSSKDRRRGLLDHLLPPAETPSGAMLCTYNGNLAVVARRLDAADAQDVADVVRRAHWLRVRKGDAYSCAMDDGRHARLDVEYPRGVVRLDVRVSGCQTATNGWITVIGAYQLVNAIRSTA